MTRTLLRVAVVTACVVGTGTVDAAPRMKWFGYGQITADSADDPNAHPTNSEDDDLGFGADRVRLGFKLKDGPVFGEVEVDLNHPQLDWTQGGGVVRNSGFGGSVDNGSTLAPGVRDVFAGYRLLGPMAEVKVGQFKTPVGMDYSTPGNRLEIAKRGMETPLLLERAMGVMVSGRHIGMGFGYDAFFGNPAARSASVNGGTPGDDHSWAVRGTFDMADMAHFEASYGESENAGVATGAGTPNGFAAGTSGGEDYSVWDVGMTMRMARITGMFEWVHAQSINGVDGMDARAGLMHAGYRLTRGIEGVFRYYWSERTGTPRGDVELGNLYVGANIFMGSNDTNGRLQVGMVHAQLEDGNWFNVIGQNRALTGFTDNTILAQYQISF